MWWADTRESNGIANEQIGTDRAMAVYGVLLAP
jgi:hypothetical protein